MHKREGKKKCAVERKLERKEFSLTSSNFLQMSVNALKMAFVGPVTVTMRSGHEPSEMLILAPDCKHKITQLKLHSFKPNAKLPTTIHPIYSDTVLLRALVTTIWAPCDKRCTRGV